MSDIVEQLKESTSISILKDPFKMDKVHGVSIHISTGFAGNKYCWGVVTFKNGNTEGKQNFENSTDFNALVKEIQSFIATLEK
jgi:hypothetical protein